MNGAVRAAAFLAGVAVVWAVNRAGLAVVGFGRMNVFWPGIALAAAALLPLARPRLRPFLWAALLAPLLLLVKPFAAACLANVHAPPRWDFLVFWLNGQVAAHGGHVYDPAAYRAAAGAAGLAGDPQFDAAVLDVGFWYPPPSILLFWPLGFGSLATAAALWHTALAATALGAAALAGRVLLPHDGAIGAALGASLLAASPAAIDNVHFSQTNFLLLALLLLYLHAPKRFAAGLCLGLAVVVKPIAAFAGVHALWRRDAKALAGAAAALLLSMAVTLAMFGPGIVTAFFASDPSHRIPLFAYTEPVNQSLLATLLRATGSTPSRLPPTTEPLFLVLVAVIGIATSAALWRLERSETRIAFALVVSAAMLVYPATLQHYGVLLVIPALALWEARNRVPWGPLGTALLCFALLAWSSVDDGTFRGALLAWAVLAAIALVRWTVTPRVRDPQQDRRAGGEPPARLVGAAIG